MFSKSEFNKNLILVMTGTGMAQAIILIFSPVLTRIFSPTEFGIFYLFSSIVDILNVPSTGRYDLAILIPKERKEAVHTLWVSGLLATCYSILIFVFILIFKDKIGIWLHEPQIVPWLFLIPVFIFLKGWMSSFHYWHNRSKRFKIITGTKIAESSVSVSSRIGLGTWSFGTGGLIIGTLLARMATLSSYLYFFWKKDRTLLRSFRKEDLLQQLRRFRNFPRNMVPAGLFNVASTQLPNILINIFYTATVVGHFGFMNRILRLPLSVLGRSFDEVFKQKASEEIQTVGHCRSIFYTTLKKLLAISIIPFGIFFFIAPWLFEFVFGAQWRIAGEYGRIFSLPLLVNFIAGSLSSIFYLTEKTKIFSRLNFLQLTLVIFAFLMCHFFNWNALTLIYLLAAGYTTSYLLMFFLLIKIVEE